MAETRVLVFDVGLRRPACVLLAAALGGDVDLAVKFPSEAWLLAPTPGMQGYAVDEQTFNRILETVKREYADA